MSKKTPKTETIVLHNYDRPECRSLAGAQRFYIEHGCSGLWVVTDGRIAKVPYRSNFEKWLIAEWNGKGGNGLGRTQSRNDELREAIGKELARIRKLGWPESNFQPFKAVEAALSFLDGRLTVEQVIERIHGVQED